MNTTTLLGAPLGLVLSLAAIQPATAQSVGSNPTGPYLGAAAGAVFFEDDDAVEFENQGASFDGQLGYRLNDNLRLELEAGVNGVGVDDSDDVLLIVRGTVGLYYDFQSSDNFIVPYIGGGLGIAGVNVVDDDDDDPDLEEEFTFHADAGVSVNFNPYIAIVPSYRYTWTDDSNDVTADNINSHAVRVGLRLSF